MLGLGPDVIILRIKRGEILSLEGGAGTKNRYRIPRYEIDRLCSPNPAAIADGPELRSLRKEVKNLQAEIRRLNSLGQGEAPECLRDVGPGLTEYSGHTSFPPSIYFLFCGEELVYIGQSVSLSSRISTHRQEGYKAFDRVFYMPVEYERLDEVERREIIKHRPRYNGGVSQFRRFGVSRG